MLSLLLLVPVSVTSYHCLLCNTILDLRMTRVDMHVCCCSMGDVCVLVSESEGERERGRGRGRERGREGRGEKERERERERERGGGDQGEEREEGWGK